MRVILLVFFIIPGVLNAQVLLSLDEAPVKLSILGEGSISTFINERDFALSPDGNELFFTITSPRSDIQVIVFSRQQGNGEWTKPALLPFAGNYSDLEPALSADGNTLYFASNRPIEGDEPKDFDIWMVSRVGDTWGQVLNLGSPVNTDQDEFYPSLTKAGHLYFTAKYKGQGSGREDIYRSEWRENKFQTPQALDTAINSSVDEFNAFISQEEDYILFSCYGRRDAGGGDLYISEKDNQDKWQPARCLTELNSQFLEYCPYVSPDGRKLFFTSNRYFSLKAYHPEKTTYSSIQNLWSHTLNGQGNIYWIDFDIVRKVK